MKRTILLITLFTICKALFSQSITIEVESSYISVGEWTTFTVTASGDIQNIKYSESDDLSITQIGKSSSYRIINGNKTRSYILKYRAKALKEGTITLPIFYTENSNGDVIKSEQTLIYVNKLEESIVTNHSINSVFETPYVKLFVEIPDRNLYVGEAIPTKVVAYFSTNFQPGIQRSPYIKTGSFILDCNEQYNNNLPEIVIDGEKWIQIAWDSHLTPLKSGDLEFEAAIDSYIEKSTGNRGFFTSSEKEDIKTSSELINIKISPLPLTNRPESFTGAIGEFSINSALDTTVAMVGDPLTLTIDLFGSGNFQRITIPKISKNLEDWKLYPESSEFKGSNGSNYKGVKSFQQIISSKNSDISVLPGFSFSFFNPVKQEYISLTTEEYPLTLTPSLHQIEGENSNILDTRFSEKKESMRHIKKGNNINYNSILKSKLFFIMLITSLLLLVTSLILILSKVSKSKKVSNSNKDHKKLKQQIIKEEDNGNYLNALKLYQELIRWDHSIKNSISAQSVTTSDLKNHMFQQIFTTLDELNYTSKLLTKEEYETLTLNISKEFTC